MKVLVATQKPFAKAAVDGIRAIVEKAGYELALLEKYETAEELYAAVADVDALIVRSDKVTAQVVDAAKNLKVVVRAGAGFDNLDLAACTANNIVAMNTPGQNSNAVAELAIGMMIYMARNTFKPGTGAELKGKKVGIQAYGNVGRLVAEKARALGMEVWAFDPFVPKEKMEAEGVVVPATLEEMYKNCNYISLHIPANDQTKKSINKALVGLMPKGGCVINTARKEVITSLPTLWKSSASLKSASSPPRKSRVPRPPRPTSMLVWPPPTRLSTSSSMATRNSRSTNNR